MKEQNTKPSCIQSAVAHFGSKAELARAMDTTIQNVYNWSVRGTFPAASALQIERVSGGRIKSRDVLLENESVSKHA